MTTFVALLRGINVSGQKQIRMAALRDSCARLGLDDVQTYLQSGNLIFRTQAEGPKSLAARLRGCIARDFGHDVEVIVLSAKAWHGLVRANPLWPRTGGQGNLYHATFLLRAVPETRLRALDPPAKSGERVAVAGGTIYLYCPDGYGKTKLNNTYFERALQTSATTRNWRTILALGDMCAGC